MAVTDVVRALGSWDLTLTDRTPQHIVDQLLNGRFGHIAIDAARDNPQVLGDALLSTARYVGVLRGAGHEAGQLALKGAGMAFWLGAADGVGDVFENAVVFADVPFATAITGLLPPGGAVTAGTITTPAGAVPYKGSHRYQTPRQAIDYVVDLYACDWRVNGDATLDVGPPDALFVADPRAAVIKRADGFDMGLRALPGSSRLDSDVEDFSTRVVTLAEGEGTSIAVGTADIAVNPFVDLHGNPIKLTRLVSESNTSLTNADARAALALAQFTTPREQVSLSSDTHDIRGDVQAGDSVWVYDPDAGLVDHDNEITFRGDRISPVKLRVFQVSWPVEQGMGVYFRGPTGEWLDLTDYVSWETGATNLTVGGYDRPLTNTNESIGFRPNITNPDTDNSIPGVPAFTPPFDQGLEVGPGGLSRASLLLTWSGPALNTDGSAFVDGAHFDIRYRPAPDYQPTWGDFTGITWGDLVGAPWNALASGAGIENPEWTYTAAPADTSVALLQGLVPGVAYEIQIRAVDAANPPHAGDWSDSLFEFIGEDTIPPQPPAAPVVAASLVQVSVRHTLGLASGGTFNLPLDLAYLEVHVGASETFTPDDTTRVGKIIATRAQISGQIPVIGTFPVATPAQVWVRVIAVDQSGNASTPSAAAPVTVELIDSQWVSDLTADKITAGSLTASYSLIGLLTAGTPGGARFEAGVNGALNGFRLYRPSGTLALHGDATTGDLKLLGTDGITANLVFTASTGLIDMRGKFTAGANFTSGARVVVDPAYVQPGGGTFPSFLAYSAGGTLGPARINASDQPTSGTGHTALGLNSGPTATGATYEQTTLFLWPTRVYLSVNASDGGVTESDRRGGSLILSKTEATLMFSPSGVDRSSLSADTNGAQIIGANTAGNTVSYVSASTGGDVELGSSVGSAISVRADGSLSLWNGSSTSSAGMDIFPDRTIRIGTTGNNYVQITPSGSSLVSNGTVKSFVIDHPVDPSKLLVHACIEGPTADLIYRGDAVIHDGRAVVELPGYFEAAARREGRQAQATPVGEPAPVATSEIVDGEFVIRCDAPDGTRVKWLATAIRADAPQFEVEPHRDSVQIGGFGPYRFISPLAA